MTGENARAACAITVTTIATSIVLHGISAQPLLGWVKRRRGARALGMGADAPRD